MSTVQRPSVHPPTNNNNSNNHGDHTNANHTSISFVDGTPPSSPSRRSSGPPSGAAKRDRKRSSLSGSPGHGVSDAGGLVFGPLRRPESRIVGDDKGKKTDGNADLKAVTARYILRQYIGFQPPTAGISSSSEQEQRPADGWKEAINESVQREAEYLLDEGSQLVREEVRNALLRTGRGGRQLRTTGVDASLKGEVEEEDQVRWRNVVVPCLTMDDIKLPGKSWTYQPAPLSKLSFLSSGFAPPAGTITGIPLADLPEWERMDGVGEAFSPVRRLKEGHSGVLPSHERTNETTRETMVDDEGRQGVVSDDVVAGGMGIGLGSPFDSQKQRAQRGKRKANDLIINEHPPPRSRPPSPTPPPRPSLLDYVPVNDLPEWEWWYDPAPQRLETESESGQQNQSQSQSIRESLRRSYNDDDGGRRFRAVAKHVAVGLQRTTTDALTMSETNMENIDQRHPEEQPRATTATTTTSAKQMMASYITDPSIAPTPTPTSTSATRHQGDSSTTIAEPARGTAYEANGRVFRRMPVVLPNLDHERMKLVHEAGKAGADAPGKAKGALNVGGGGKRGGKPHPQVNAEGLANKRVMQLQNGQPQHRQQHQPQQIRPIKSFLPMPLLGGPHVEGLKNATQAVEGSATANDSIVDMDDISMAESTHLGYNTATIDMQEHTAAIDVQEHTSEVVGPPTILVEGEPAVMSSPIPIAGPSRPTIATPVVISKQEKARRRILGDAARYGQHYEIITEPHTLGILDDAATHVHIPPALQFIEPIPLLPAEEHPFHPFLEYYITKRPYARVKWLIPVHGPVTVPGLSEERAWDGFQPSDGHLALGHDEYREVRRKYRQFSAPVPGAASTSSVEKSRPRPLLLTEELLREIWNKLVRLRKFGRFGPIALALSSPHPDPFRPTGKPTTSLSRHNCIPTSPIGESVHSMVKPVKPEVGDHIKLFCDLRYAMAIRFVLKGMELGDVAVSVSRATLVDRVEQDAPELPTRRTRLAPTHSSATSRSSKSTSGSLTPFRGVRLCLVGDRGEVLTVV